MGKILQCTKPLRMWIDGTCFNIKRLEKVKKAVKSNLSNQAESDSDSGVTDVDRNSFALNKIDDNFTTTFELPSTYYIRLNHFPDFNIKSLETKTNTNISIPEGDGSITITGNDEANVINARHLIHSVICEIREKQFATQFISIPVHTEEVQTNFERFKKEILSGTNSSRGIDETIFQSSLKLHLTVGVFALMSDAEKEEAISALNAYKTEIIQPLISNRAPLKITVSGIDCMTSNYSKVNVLYANARIEKEGEDFLQKLANGLSNYFYERGLLIQHTDNVKLHVTLMNTKYRKLPAGKNTPKKSKWGMKRQPFDATGILQKYKNFYFGESTLDSIHLSYISSIGEDGFYKALSIITF